MNPEPRYSQDLHVLDDRLLEHRRVVCDSYDRGDRLQADPPSCAPSALTRDQLVAIAGRPYEYRLEDTHLADRFAKSSERFLVKMLARAPCRNMVAW